MFMSVQVIAIICVVLGGMLEDAFNRFLATRQWRERLPPNNMMFSWLCCEQIFWELAEQKSNVLFKLHKGVL